MINLDLEGLKSLVYVYGSREGIIRPDTWEKIICKSVGGTHIPGDKYMADGFKKIFGLNIKSLLQKCTKGNKQTCSYVQCRCPLNESGDIGSEIIKILVNKREESFKTFDLNKMMDVLIIHNRSGNDYNVRVLIKEQPKYEDLNFEWYGKFAYLNPDKSKKSWKGKWKMKRVPGNASAFQTCLYIKEIVDYTKCIANFTVRCDDDYDISIEDAKKKYAKVQ